MHSAFNRKIMGAEPIQSNKRSHWIYLMITGAMAELVKAAGLRSAEEILMGSSPIRTIHQTIQFIVL